MSPESIAKLGVCHVPEGRGVFPELSVRENLLILMNGRRDGIEDAIQRFPILGKRLKQAAGQMSGGEQQMLALCPALNPDQKLLLVDELSLGLSPLLVDHLYDFIEELVARSQTIIIVEQFADKALELATSAFVMRKGTLVYEGSARELAGQTEHLHDLYMGVSS
jgi:branched-chain amino acid transport system ATP-binding protein